MSIRLASLSRVGRQVLKAILIAGLVTWAAAAPLVWILRDGLGPDMVESRGRQAAFKFLTGWGVPAMALAVPLIGLSLVDRWLAKPVPGAKPAEATRGEKEPSV